MYFVLRYINKNRYPIYQNQTNQQRKKHQVFIFIKVKGMIISSLNGFRGRYYPFFHSRSDKRSVGVNKIEKYGILV